MFISKRALWIIGVIVVVVMLAVGIGLAYAFSSLGQANAANSNLSATATASAQVTPAAKKTAQRRAVGVIQSLGNQSFVLSTQQGKHTITVDVSSSTKYTRAGQSASFSDLQVGETVAVTGTFDTKTKTAHATRIVIAPASKSATPTPTTSPTATP